jgi:hypothetical protein
MMEYWKNGINEIFTRLIPSPFDGGGRGWGWIRAKKFCPPSSYSPPAEGRRVHFRAFLQYHFKAPKYYEEWNDGNWGKKRSKKWGKDQDRKTGFLVFPIFQCSNISVFKRAFV